MSAHFKGREEAMDNLLHPNYRSDVVSFMALCAGMVGLFVATGQLLQPRESNVFKKN